MSPALPTTSSEPAKADEYYFQVYDRPGLTLPSPEQTQLIHDLSALASKCLHPVPDYQCLSSSPHALDDKLIVVMRSHLEPHPVIAFVSAVYLSISLSPDAAPTTVLHTGLTCITPGSRRQGLTVPLFVQLFAHLRKQHAFARGAWITTLAEVASSLGNIARYGTDVFPSPTCAAPSAVHVRIAEAVSQRYRSAMLIAPQSRFDVEKFVFRSANSPGSCFRKDTEDKRFHHRNQKLNEYYLKLLGRNEGNAVLQVGYLDWKRVFGTLKSVGHVDARTKEKARL